jgi:hypothetical protein
MMAFESTGTLFQVVHDLVARLEAAGHPEEAGELRSGFGCLNGLTDGWGLFLESIDEVRAERSRFDPEDRRALDGIRGAVRSIVFRR